MILTFTDDEIDVIYWAVTYHEQCLFGNERHEFLEKYGVWRIEFRRAQQNVDYSHMKSVLEFAYQEKALGKAVWTDQPLTVSEFIKERILALLKRLDTPPWIT